MLTETGRRILEYLKKRRTQKQVFSDKTQGWTSGNEIIRELGISSDDYVREAGILQDAGYIRSEVRGAAGHIDSPGMLVQATNEGMGALDPKVPQPQVHIDNVNVQGVEGDNIIGVKKGAQHIIVVSSHHHDPGLPDGQRKCPSCGALWVASGSQGQNNFTVTRAGVAANSRIIDLFGNNAAVSCC
jgi:hypothetical protein